MLDANNNQPAIYMITPSSLAALRELQKAIEGEAERTGLYTEDDVVALVKKVRAEIASEKSHTTKGDTQP